MKPYFENEKHGIKLFHADCRELLPLFLKDTFDVVLTDPPYGVNLGKSHQNNQTVKRSEYFGTEDTPEYVIPLVRLVIGFCIETVPLVVVTPGVRNMFKYQVPSHVGSFYYPSANGCNSWGFSCWQPIFYYGKDPYGGDGSRHDSIMSVESAERNGHPCPKPINQWMWLLDRVSRGRQHILDPFAGSGTTGVACILQGREFTGIEIEERYCEIAANRMQREIAQGRLFEPERPKETQMCLTD